MTHAAAQPANLTGFTAPFTAAFVVLPQVPGDAQEITNARELREPDTSEETTWPAL
jgi:hypothetical protein